MLIVSGTARIQPDKIDQAKTVAARMVAATVQEPGCLAYAFAQDVSDPTLFRIYEEWETEAALYAHFETPHMAEFQAALPGIITTRPAIRRFDVTDARDL